MKKNYLRHHLFFTIITTLMSFLIKAQSTCHIDELKRLDVNYNSPCEGDAVVLDAIRFHINTGTVSWFKVGAPLPAVAYAYLDQLYIIPYYNQYHGLYGAVFTDFASGCTDTLLVQVDSIIPAVDPEIIWVQDLCSAVKMKAVNLNDTTAANNTYAWMDQNGNFSLFSQYVITNNYTETVRITNIAGCTGYKYDYMPESHLQTPTIDSAINFTGGPAQICQNNYLRTYFIYPQSGVSYNWVVPTGCTILSGQGTTSINVAYNNSFVSGTLSITKSSPCGSATKSVIVKKGTIPSKPGAISGTSTGLCGASNLNYTVTNINGVIYNWTVPTGAIITSGQGTSHIIVNFPSTNFTGTISVTASNNCGTSAARTVSVKATPSTPTAINGPIIVCSGSNGNFYTVNPVASVTSYKWTAPTGSHIIANGITSATNTITTTATTVTVNFGTVVSTSKVSVLAINSCGNGGTKSLTLTPCAVRLIDEAVFKNKMVLFPNPTNNDVTIRLESQATGNIYLLVTDLFGRIQQTKEIVVFPGINEYPLDLSSLRQGCYVVQLLNADIKEEVRIIKN